MRRFGLIEVTGRLDEEGRLLFVDVGVPLAISGTLTYRLPERWRSLARPGVRARVPVGKRRYTGVVLAVHGKPPAGVKLRSQASRPDAVVAARLLNEDVEREMKRLPERQQMALWLCAAEGQSYAEIASGLETSEKSVKALVHRARATLADRLGSRL